MPRDNVGVEIGGKKAGAVATCFKLLKGICGTLEVSAGHFHALA